MKYNPEIFREYDIRGKYNIDFDDEFSFRLGRAFYSYCKANTSTNDITIAIGIDARHSSQNLSSEMIKGILSAGGKVFDLGLVTSPLTYFACHHIDGLAGAVMITGSHNPPEYNGFKISLAQDTLTGENIKEIKDILDTDNLEENKKSESTLYDIISPYVQRLGSEFPDLSGVKVVLDCGNGAAGSVARKAFEACNVNTQILFEEPDGDFPNHHPDPTLEENLVDLKKAVTESKADIGIGYDGDCDRIVVVTNSGETVYADQLMAIYAKDIIEKQNGATIIADVKCSDEYFKLVEKWGGNPVMWKTGHSIIKKKVKEEKAPFGGEFSGHIFFADRFYGFDDAIYCSLRIIEIMKNSGFSVKELISEFPETFSTPEIRIEVGEKEKYEVVETYRKEIKKFANSLNEIDGVRASFDGGWALVRVSNTQPVVTMRFEANSVQELDRIKQISSEILGIL